MLIQNKPNKHRQRSAGNTWNTRAKGAQIIPGGSERVRKEKEKYFWWDTGVKTTRKKAGCGNNSKSRKYLKIASRSSTWGSVRENRFFKSCLFWKASAWNYHVCAGDPCLNPSPPWLQGWLLRVPGGKKTIFCQFSFPKLLFDGQSSVRAGGKQGWSSSKRKLWFCHQIHTPKPHPGYLCQAWADGAVTRSPWGEGKSPIFIRSVISLE